MDRRTFLKRLITFPKREPNDNVIINGDLEVRGKVSVGLADAPAFVIMPQTTKRLEYIYDPQTMAPITPKITDPPYRLTIGDKANG